MSINDVIACFSCRRTVGELDAAGIDCTSEVICLQCYDDQVAAGLEPRVIDGDGWAQWSDEEERRWESIVAHRTQL